MADLTKTESQIGMVDPVKAVTVQAIAAEALPAGTPVYVNATTGKATKGAAGAAATAGVRGITIEPAGAGQPVTLLKLGGLYGYDLTALKYDALVFLSDTAGSLVGAKGTTEVKVGRVLALTDPPATKILWVDLREAV